MGLRAPNAVEAHRQRERDRLHVVECAPREQPERRLRLALWIEAHHEDLIKWGLLSLLILVAIVFTLEVS